MTADDYIATRIQHQIDWFERKSSSYQKTYKRLRLAEIILGALIPLISGITISLSDYELIGGILVGMLGVAVASIAGILSIGQHQENWINYRNNSERLKRQKFLFQTGVSPYNTDDGFIKLVQTTEAILAKENSKWTDYNLEEEG